jgi:hypothetical protein
MHNRISLLQVSTHNKSTRAHECIIPPQIAVGMDGCVRCWCLHIGRQLSTLACPSPVTDHTTLPRVSISTNWGGVQGTSAVVMAHNDKLYVYDMPLVRDV